MTTTNVPNCTTCGYDPKDDDPVMGYDDFRGGAVFHAECLANALHDDLKAARALLVQAAIPLEALWSSECDQARGRAMGCGLLCMAVQQGIVEAVGAIRAFLTRVEAQS